MYRNKVIRFFRGVNLLSVTTVYQFNIFKDVLYVSWDPIFLLGLTVTVCYQ